MSNPINICSTIWRSSKDISVESFSLKPPFETPLRDVLKNGSDAKRYLEETRSSTPEETIIYRPTFRFPIVEEAGER